MIYKIFCDESNHLLTDNSNIIVNGAILIDKVIEITKLDDLKFGEDFNYFKKTKTPSFNSMAKGLLGVILKLYKNKDTKSNDRRY